MKLDLNKYLNYAAACLPHASTLERATLNRLRSFFESRLAKGAKFTNSKTVFKKLANTGLTKAKQEISFFYKMIKSLEKTGLLEALEYKHAKRTSKLGRKVAKKRKPLVSKFTFRAECQRLIAKGDALLVLGLHVMLCTGKRRKNSGVVMCVPFHVRTSSLSLQKFGVLARSST